jgi:FkbM family methyltransferase
MADTSALRSLDRSGTRLNVVDRDVVPVTFWDDFQSSAWEPETTAIFDACINSDTTFLDIGAWIGPTALYGAQRAKKTLAFEPDPVAFAALEQNVAANSDASWADRLTIHNKAVMAKAGSLKFGSRKGGGDSTSSVLFADGETVWTVEGVAFSEVFANDVPKTGKLFAKIDIEGGEYELIPAIASLLAQRDFALLLSIHARYVTPKTKRFFTGPLKALLGRRESVAMHAKLLDAVKDFTILNEDGTSFDIDQALADLKWQGTFANALFITNKPQMFQIPGSSHAG